MIPRLLFGLAAIAGIALQAQQAPKATGADENAPPSIVENGSLIYVELAKTVDAKKAKPGDPVTATLLADVLSHGKIVLHREAKLIGHVSEAQAHSKENPESRLGIIFDKAIAKGGHEVAFSSVLLALRPAPQLHIDPLSAPAPPGTNPANTPPTDRHYPMPKGPTVPRTSPTMTNEIDAHSREMSDLRPTDIDGLSLVPSADGANKVVVSFRQTVKLESGVRMDLRVTGVPQSKKD